MSSKIIKEQLEQAIAQKTARHRAAQLDEDDPILAGFSAPRTERAVRIPLDKLIRSQYQVREVDDTYIEDLMESIKDTKGLISPIIVRVLNDGYEVIAGHTRAEAFRRLGETHIEAIVRQLSDAEAAKALAADNVTRKDLTDYELYKQIAILFSNNFLKSNSEASRLLGRSRQDIIRYQAYGRMSHEIIDLLERRPNLFGASLAKDLVDLIDKGHGNVVTLACEKLFDGHIRNQQGVMLWIHQRLADRPAKREVKVMDSTGKVAGRLIITEDGIKITGKHLDYPKLAELIERSISEAIEPSTPS